MGAATVVVLAGMTSAVVVVAAVVVVIAVVVVAAVVVGIAVVVDKGTLLAGAATSTLVAILGGGIGGCDCVAGLLIRAACRRGAKYNAARPMPMATRKIAALRNRIGE